MVRPCLACRARSGGRPETFYPGTAFLPGTRPFRWEGACGSEPSRHSAEVCLSYLEQVYQIEREMSIVLAWEAGSPRACKGRGLLPDGLKLFVY
jgi:hypothetical protein